MISSLVSGVLLTGSNFFFVLFQNCSQHFLPAFFKFCFFFLIHFFFLLDQNGPEVVQSETGSKFWSSSAPLPVRVMSSLFQPVACTHFV